MKKYDMQKYQNRSWASKIVVRDKKTSLYQVNLPGYLFGIILAIIKKTPGIRKC